MCTSSGWTGPHVWVCHRFYAIHLLIDKLKEVDNCYRYSIHYSLILAQN